MAGKRTRAKQKKGPAVIRGLDNETVLTALEDLGRKLCVEIRHENGDFKSAGCRVEDKSLILLKKSASLSKKIKVLLREFASVDTTEYAIDPAIKRRLEEEKMHLDKHNEVEENQYAEKNN